MGIKKKNGPYYYAAYHDEYGSSRCVSLKTANKQVALRLYQDIIRRRNAAREKLHIFPIKLLMDNEAFSAAAFDYVDINYGLVTKECYFDVKIHVINKVASHCPLVV